MLETRAKTQDACSALCLEAVASETSATFLRVVFVLRGGWIRESDWSCSGSLLYSANREQAKVGSELIQKYLGEGPKLALLAC